MALIELPGLAGDPGRKDATDWFARCGGTPERLSELVEAAPEWQAPASAKVAPGAAPAVELVRGADVAARPVVWLWREWLAAGKLHVLAGAPGTGKTSLALDLAATVTAGGAWPDGARPDAGDVLIWSGEDDAADTLVPRLRAAGADLQRALFVAGVRAGGGNRPFDPATDMRALEEAERAIGRVRMLIVDPFVSAVAADSHRNAETRRALQPLVDLGTALGCAVLGIGHFTKGTAGRDPVERVTGSLAFGAVARIVLVAAKLLEQDGAPGGRLLARAKSNLGPDVGGLRSELEREPFPGFPGEMVSRVRWLGAVEVRPVSCSPRRKLTRTSWAGAGLLGNSCSTHSPKAPAP